MTEVLLSCPRCGAEVAVAMPSAVLRTDVEPRACAELLFSCPACQAPVVRPVSSQLLSLLLLVGHQPLRLSEPALPAEDLPGEHPRLTLDDLLRWHEDLNPIQFVIPWERDSQRRCS